MLLVGAPLGMVAQKPDIVVPGSPSINTALLRTGSFVWERPGGGVFASGEPQQPKQRFVDISRTASEIVIAERYNEEGADVVKRKLVLDARTFAPLRAQAETVGFAYDLVFGKALKGDLEVYRTGEKEHFDEALAEPFFVGSSLEFLVSLLPLKAGYRAVIPQVTFDDGFRTKVMRWEIESVQEMKMPSCSIGEVVDVFVVELRNTLTETNTYKIVLEKDGRRILFVSKDPGSFGVTYVDTQVDSQPISTPFDAAAARAMISEGSASIEGQAYTTDEGMPTAILDRPKKILAPKGSIVMLIPNTPYFKAWLEFNTAVRSKFPPTIVAGQVLSGCAGYPVPVEVKEQTLLTEVTDDRGGFSFQHLKPGEYHVIVQFVATKYTHTTRTPTGGYTVTVYPDGAGTATPTMDVRHWGSPTNVSNYALVRIAAEGEKVRVKLKD
ncbi:MAG: hypothetical protein ACO1NQ_10390 [Flavobacteriales bacterium]